MDHLQEIIEYIESGENVLIHGPGGCGKSYTIKKIAAHFCDKGWNVGITATTGIAASCINDPEAGALASTLHSWAGIRLGDGSVDVLETLVRSSKKALLRWLTCRLLIIDEVSMLSYKLFEKLDSLGKRLLGNNKPFGGITILLSGDFLQLPPVKDSWVFNSEAYKDLNLKAFKFEVPYRYDDINWFNTLLRIRVGEHTPEDVKVLRKRKNAYKKMEDILRDKDPTKIIKPSILYSRKMDVLMYNKSELDKLEGEEVHFIATDLLTQRTRKEVGEAKYKVMMDDNIPYDISLKVGAQVMLKYNVSVEEGLVNGSRGVVTSIEEVGSGGDENVMVGVRFINGMQMTFCKSYSWSVGDKEAKLVRKQIPLILAWSVTVHKSQGCTLDYACIDLGDSIFEDGQAYVALSRVRNTRSLFISKFKEKSLLTNKEAVEYANSL